MTHSLKVLNIEDSEDDALLVMRELRRSGLNIIWERVETAEALGAALEKQTWDVIISDYHLPKFSASDALQIVKSRYPNLPFIVVSGTIGETAAVELMKAGAHDYLMKGSLARLSEAVRREVRDAENRLERQRSQLELDLVKERLQLAVTGSGIGLWDWAIQTDEVIINERLAEIFGYTLAELEQFGTQTWWQLNHPEDSQKAKLAIESHFQQKTLVYECEFRKHHKSGAWVWVLSRGKVMERDVNGKPLRMTGTILDISDRKQTELRVEMRNSILKCIAKGEPLADILDAQVRAMEEQIEGAICSILLCDRQGKLRHGSSPNLPTEYNKAIEGITIGEGVGSCGTAAFRKQPVIVSDIATDPLWQDYKEFVLAYNLRSCWSFPAIASDGSVLATLAVYHHDVHSPQQSELDEIAIATNIVKIAIEKEQATQTLEQLNHELEGRVERRTKALRQSKARLHEAQQIAHLGSWEIDLLSQKLIWSAEVFKIFGLDRNQPEPTYAEMLQYYPLDERKRVIDFVDRAMQGQPYEADFQIIRADGSSAYTFAKAEPIWDAAGQVIGLFGIVMDISDRKQTELELQKTMERLALALKSGAIGYWEWNIQQNILFWDEQMHELYGLHKEKDLRIAYEIWAGSLHPVDRATSELKLQPIATGQVDEYDTEFRVIHPDGSIHFIKAYGSLKRDPSGNPASIIGINFDITERKQAEQKISQYLRQQQALGEIALAVRESLSVSEILATLTQQVKDVMQCDRVIAFRLFPEGRTQIVEESVSSEFKALKNQSWGDEVWGQDCLEYYWRGEPRIVPDVMNDIWTYCLQEYSIEGQIQSKIVAPILQDARIGENYLWVNPDKPIKIWGVLVVHACAEKRVWLESEGQLLQQIANQLAIAIQRASLFEQLQQELAERQQAEAELTDSNQQLSRATRMKDEFLANMSHELRTPLNSILGMTEGLQEGVFGSVNDQQIKALQTVERSGNHLLELINDILDVAKIESGQIEFDYTLVSVSYLCQSSLTFIKQQAMKKRINLEIKLPQNLPDLLVDERRIRQVLINLLNNAVKFTLEGGHIILEVTQLPSSPDFSLQRFLRIAVIDSGIGIASENIKKLFQPFIQIDSALNRQYAGTGLGLALVKQITELHGGRVGLTSELGVGSCFMIDLPYTSDSLELMMDKQSSVTLTLKSPLTNQAIPTPLILIADDNEANISTISSYLEAKGYRLLVARNGKEAVDLTKVQHPDLILMDIQMPVMDGLEATKQIRLDPKLINIPIIALTALAMTGDREKCLEVGINEYLTKPFKLKVLAMAIQQLLS